MMYVESYETENLRKLIENKKQFFIKQTNPTAAKILQNEILFLQNDILPNIQKNTMLIHCEFSKYAVRAFDKALETKCNALLLYQPINELYENKPLIGIANTRQLQAFGTFGAMEIGITNMDGNGAKVHPINLPLNDLM